MTHDWAQSLDFVAQGTRLVAESLAELPAARFDEPTLLPAWNRRQLVAHLAANAEALGRLVAWARTGVPTPMYGSPDQRTRDIETGAVRPVEDLVAWFEESARELSDAFASLPDELRSREVRTAQGRLVPASETAWMRAREVLVHAVDLDLGVGFADLPEAFLEQLRTEILAKRADQDVPPLAGPLPEVVAHLAGRPAVGVTRLDGGPVPQLPPWL